MKLLTLLFRRARGLYLRSRIESIRPDLTGLRFEALVDGYVEGLIKERLSEDPTISDEPLPWLAEAALTHTASEQAGRYRAKAMLAEAYYWKEFEDHSKTASRNIDLTSDRNGYREVAETAVNTVEQTLAYLNNPIKPDISLN